MIFQDFNLEDSVVEAIEAMGFREPTEVQQKTIPLILEGKDIIASAQTGTGKTAAFLLPVISNIVKLHADNHHTKAVVVVPTRELAVQIDQQMTGFGYFSGISSIAVYGGGDGSSFDKEKQALIDGVDIIIGTPGRLKAHLNLGYVKTNGTQFLILDEADRMLDMGFSDDINKIISYLPKKRQNLLFSATMPPKIRDLARKVLTDPAEINIAISKPSANIKQYAFILYSNQKLPLIEYILKTKSFNSVLVFCSTKSATKEITRSLKKLNLPAEEIHSDLEQKEREEVLLKFRNKKLTILVATDILSRGIDIDNIELVINYDVPNDGEDYVHRIGRTARAASKGAAFTFVGEAEQRDFYQIEQLIEKEVPKVKLPEHLGDTPEYKPSFRSGGGGRKGNFGGRKRNGGGKRKR